MVNALLIIIPVYNDWESLQVLQREIETCFIDNTLTSISFLIVDDSSEIKINIDNYIKLKHQTIILELNQNLGHQKAIATGLAYAYGNLSADHIIIMDGDGEDKPTDISTLLSKSPESKGIVFAKRTKRSEGFIFRLFYQLYKSIFKLLTGKSISFGNFCLIPSIYLSKIVHVADIWNHFSGGIIRSGVPYTALATERGKRYHGESKMNFTRLILHGLSAISVYVDFMAIRLILFSVFLIIITAIGISIVVYIRIFTNLAIPGWATFTGLALSMILFQSLILGLFLLFNVLSLQTHKRIIPAKDYTDYVLNIKIIEPND